MPTRPHLASLLPIFLSLATANAQDEARRRLDELVDEAKLQLRSGDPKTIAWGAHTAAEHRLFACRDDLCAADWRKVVTACVDKKLIPADAAKGLAPQIVLGEWNLRDWRNDTSIPLPEVR